MPVRTLCNIMLVSLTADKIEREEEGECSDVVGELVPLERFDYDNHKMGCLLRESLDQTNFLGISVSFPSAHILL